MVRGLFHQRQETTAVAYFYFDFRDETAQRVKIMLRSIILQLSAQSPNPYSALNRQYNFSQGQSLPTYDNLLGILDELLSEFEHTYIVLDALDECNERDRLVQFILRLQGWTDKSLHLLFTSQPRELFTKVFKDTSLVVLSPEITQRDIKRFIDDELPKLSHLTHCTPTREITTKILMKSNGM